MSELVWGIKNGDIDQVKDIVEQKKIDVNALIDGRVPLHYAADYGQTAVVNYLLDKGADPNMSTDHRPSLMSDVTLIPQPSSSGQFMSLFQCAEGCPKLHLLALTNQSILSKAQRYLKKMVDKHGISVILAAIWEGHTDCVKTLLKHGASKNGKTPDGTPYIEAAEKEEIKELLT